MTKAEIDAINAQIVAMNTLIAAKIALPQSASNSMGSVSQRSMEDLYAERDRLTALLNPPTASAGRGILFTQLKAPGGSGV